MCSTFEFHLFLRECVRNLPLQRSGGWDRIRCYRLYLKIASYQIKCLYLSFTYLQPPPPRDCAQQTQWCNQCPFYKRTLLLGSCWGTAGWLRLQMETGQLLETRLELPFSPANGYLLKSHVLLSYCSGLFSLQQSELDMSSSCADVKKLLHCSKSSVGRWWIAWQGR